MWAVYPEVLRHYARHFRTGQPMPLELVDKIAATRKFNQGFETTEYLAASLLDQAWHQLAPAEVPPDVAAFEADTLDKDGLAFAPVPPRYRSTYFSHAFSLEYSAGYYAYVWAEVLVADSIEWFKAHGGPTRQNGDFFRRSLLSRGCSGDVMDFFRAFNGGPPDLAPLLRRRGLDGAQAPRVAP
jgi:peptidyl-dipeptidase Dcp